MNVSIWKSAPPRLGLALMLAAAVVASSGCQRVRTTEGPAPSVRVDDARIPNAGVRLNEVRITDKALQSDVQSHGFFEPIRAFFFGKRRGTGRVTVERHRPSWTPLGHLRVDVLMRNRTDYTLQIEGRTQFYDAEGFALERPTAWRRVIMGPNTSDSYTESSISELASYYYVEIREGR